MHLYINLGELLCRVMMCLGCTSDIYFVQRVKQISGSLGFGVFEANLFCCSIRRYS
jgi:hypothetical protein